MRNDFFQRKLLQSFVQPQLIAPHHLRVDIVMLAGDAPEMQIDRPSAGEVEGRPQIPNRFRDLK
jgi:hypothetical protein